MANQVVDSHIRIVPEISLPKLETSIPQSKVHGRVISTRVVGVTFEGRQEIVAQLHEGDHIWLEREPNNRYDYNAIRVSRSNGEQIGYLNRHLAANLTPYLDAYGKPVRGKVILVTGSRWDNYSLGVIVAFKLPKLNQSRKNRSSQYYDEWEE